MGNKIKSLNELAGLIAVSEDRLMKILLTYALERGYTRYTSTLEEAWRMSVSALSMALMDACKNWDGPPELSPDDDYLSDPISRFGIAEAQKHRARGISLDMFLGLMKYYRQSYLDVVRVAGFEREYEETCRLFINRFYDRVELGFCKEWVNIEQTRLMDDLQTINRIVTTEKNKFLTVYESLPNPVILINTELGIENMNRAAMRFLQGKEVPGAYYYRSFFTEHDAEEIVSGQRFEELFPWLTADVRSFVGCNDQSCTVEKSVQIGSGTIHYEVKISRMLDISEKFTGLIIVLSDITKRKQAEEELRERNVFIEAVLDNLPIGIAVNSVNPNITFNYMNDNFPKYYRTTREKLSDPDAFWEVVYEESDFREEIKRKVLGDCASGEPTRMIWAEVPITRRGEETTFITARNIPIPNEQLMASIVWDITDRKRMEETLSAERELLGVTLASIGDGVITTDVHGKITYINRVAKELTGWSHNQAVGRNLADVFHIINEQTREICENPVDKVLKSGGVVGLANHTALIRRDGREMTIDDSGAPIRNREGNIIGVVLVFRDITEKERAQRSLQNAQKMEAVGELAGGIAHDFNNLLGGIFGYLELARVQTESEDCKTAANTLSKVIDVFDRAKHLTRQLLTFSKGGTPIRKTQSITECVRKSVSFALSGSNISPIFAIPSDVWLCNIDENQVEQVFDNITINARQAMPSGGKLGVTIRNIPLEESPEALPPSAYVCVSIRDEGAGIAKEHLSRIFEPFFTTKQQGSGLGLATCYSIIRKHEGRIDVDSEFGKGTCFHIYLPASTALTSIEKNVKQDTHQGTGKMLVMDDEPPIRELLAIMLERMGYCVMTAKNGDEALEIAKSAIQSGQPFVAAILDLTVPGGRGGKETVRDLLEMDPNIKIIASSGYSEDPIMSHPSDYGFVNRLIKPYRTGDLIKALESIYSRSC